MKEALALLRGEPAMLARLPEPTRELYSTWSGMLQRCYNPNVANYSYYGGRGIKVCDRWLGSYALFAQDMGPRPSPLHSIDRKNNDGNYEPDNCRWATKTEQLLNRRASRRQNAL